MPGQLNEYTFVAGCGFQQLEGQEEKSNLTVLINAGLDWVVEVAAVVPSGVQRKPGTSVRDQKAGNDQAHWLT